MKRFFNKNKQREDSTVPVQEIDETPQQPNEPSQPVEEQAAPHKRRLAFGRSQPTSANVSRSNSTAARNIHGYAEQTVGYLVGSGRDDWTRALLLADSVSSSEETAKEVAKALRKEFEFAAPDAKIRAHRLLVILMRNSGDRFKLKIANKKFLDVVDKVYKSKTPPFEVKDSMVKAFQVLAYDCKDDADLSSITSLYNRIKPPAAPINGHPLEEGDATYDPTVRERSSRRRPSQNRQPDLWREAELARNSSNMLIEALSFTALEEVDSNQIIQEFYAACLKSQELFLDALPWAHSSAEQAALKQAQLRSQHDTSQTNPDGEQPLSQGETTVEEQLLAVLTSAHEELNSAFKMYDDTQRRKRQLEEEQMVQERSKVEFRANHQDVYNSTLAPSDGPQASGSRSASPQPMFDTRLGAPGHSITGLTPPLTTEVQGYHTVPMVADAPSVPLASPTPVKQYTLDDFEEQLNHNPSSESNRMSRNPYFNQMATNDQPQAVPDLNGLRLSSNNPFAKERTDEHGYRSDSPEALDEEPRTPDRNPFHRPHQLSTSSARSNRTTYSEDTPVTPIEPSSKALGKQRRFSRREDDELAEAKEREAEEELREKYRLAAEEKAQRRTQGQ